MLEKFGRRSHGAGGTAGILGLLAKVQEILWRVVRGFGRLVLQRVELWMLAAVWIVEWGAHLL